LRAGCSSFGLLVVNFCPRLFVAVENKAVIGPDTIALAGVNQSLVGLCNVARLVSEDRTAIRPVFDR
jgi:hypothetical protein